MLVARNNVYGSEQETKAQDYNSVVKLAYLPCCKPWVSFPTLKRKKKGREKEYEDQKCLGEGKLEGMKGPLIKVRKVGAGGVVQQFRELAALPEDPS